MLQNSIQVPDFSTFSDFGFLKTVLERSLTN